MPEPDAWPLIEARALAPRSRSRLGGLARHAQRRVYEPKKYSAGYGAASGPGVSTGSVDGYSQKAFKPYDYLKYATAETQKSVNKTNVSFDAGDKVSHAKFGEGLVIQANDRIVTVAFDSVGIKKLAKDVAPIEKIR